MQHSLIKLIDIALVPAFLMVGGKLLGLIVTINLFGLPWQIQDLPGSLFNVQPVVFAEDLQVASSYSDIIMYLILAIGFSVILLMATRFHDTHIKPSLLVKLSNNNLLGLVKSSFDIYHAAAIWLLFIWLAALIVGVNVLTGKTYSWVLVIVVLANIVFTSLMLQDVYKEIEQSKRNLSRFEALS